MGLTILSFEIAVKSNEHLGAAEPEQNDLHKTKALLLRCLISLHSLQLAAPNETAAEHLTSYLVLFYGADHKTLSNINITLRTYSATSNAS